MTNRLFSLSGRGEEPTDGIADYCRLLGQALAARGHDLEHERLPWPEKGWGPTLGWLRRQALQRSGRWTLIQYAAFSWSKSGIPLSLPAAVRVLQQAGVKVAVVFHDVRTHQGRRSIDRFRARLQRPCMRMAARRAERAILTIPTEQVTWLPRDLDTATFIPVGSNVPSATQVRELPESAERSVAVFGVTGGDAAQREVADIALAARRAAATWPKLRLVVMGRGAEAAGESLERSLKGASVELSIRGVLPAEEVSRTLSGCHAQLFVRDHLSTRRGSGLAGIGCGLPVVGYEGPETGPPITAGGVRLVPAGDSDSLATALLEVLGSQTLWSELHRRSLEVHREHLAWPAIAGRLIGVLGLEEPPPR